LGVLVVASGLSRTLAERGPTRSLGCPPAAGRPDWQAVPDVRHDDRLCSYRPSGVRKGVSDATDGFLLALGAAAGFWVALHITLTGSQLGRTCARMMTPRVLWAMAGLLVAAWAYKYVTWPTNG